MLAAFFARLRKLVARWFGRRDVPSRVPDPAPHDDPAPPPAEWLARRQPSPPAEWLERVGHVTWQTMRVGDGVTPPAPPPPAPHGPVFEPERAAPPDTVVEWPAIAAWDVRHHWRPAPRQIQEAPRPATTTARHDSASPAPRRVAVSPAFGDPSPLSRKMLNPSPEQSDPVLHHHRRATDLSSGVAAPKSDRPADIDTPRRRRTDSPPERPAHATPAPAFESNVRARAIGDDVNWPDLPPRRAVPARFAMPERTPRALLTPGLEEAGGRGRRGRAENAGGEEVYFLGGFRAPAQAATATAPVRADRPPDDTGESPSLWPALPDRADERAPAESRETLNHWRREQKLDREQRGDVWNAWPF